VWRSLKGVRWKEHAEAGHHLAPRELGHGHDRARPAGLGVGLLGFRNLRFLGRLRHLFLLHLDRDAWFSRFHRRLLLDRVPFVIRARNLHAIEVFRINCRNAVLALRRRHLGRAVLDILSLVIAIPETRIWWT